MTTSRIKEKISSIVSSQLPEFIQNDYTTFVTFLEAYYKFLEQDQGAFEVIQNLRSYSDIDKTTESFVKYFIKNYADLIPDSVLANKKLLVKRIKDLYESKGSELSFDLLFRILYNTTVSINYPNEFVLRASDGRWEQKVSLRLQTVSGDRSLLPNRLLTYTSNNNILYETPILEIKNLTSTLTEVFLDPNQLASGYTLGDTVYVYSGSNVLFSGNIAPTINDYTVSSGGLGFKIGQVYNVGGGGLGTIVKISNTNSVGAITELKFIEYGYGFNTTSTAFSLDLDPTKNFAESVDILADSTNGFISDLSIITDNVNSSARYFDTSDYVEPFYTFTEILSSAFSSSSSITPATSNKPANFATITFRLGSLGRYPGAFTAVNGFLSEPEVRLQDNALYQPFAYQTNTDRDISEFGEIIKSLIHPAGQKLFNNRLLNSNIDLSGGIVVSPTSNVFFEALDVINITDSIVVSKVFNRVISDTANVEESLQYQVTSAQVDTSNVVESIALEVQSELENQTFTLTDSTLIEKNLFKDSQASFDSQPTLNVSIVINTSTNTPTDDIEGILVNYAEPGYFLEVYAGEPII